MFHRELAQQPVRVVLVAAALPGRAGVAEVDLRSERELDASVTASSLPLSQVIDRRRCSGSRLISRIIASATLSASRRPGRCNQIVNRVVRSTSVPTADPVSLAPMIRSPSQWPGTARSATSAGRWLIRKASSYGVEPPRRASGRGAVGATACGSAVGAGQHAAHRGSARTTPGRSFRPPHSPCCRVGCSLCPARHAICSSVYTTLAPSAPAIRSCTVASSTSIEASLGLGRRRRFVRGPVRADRRPDLWRRPCPVAGLLSPLTTLSVPADRSTDVRASTELGRRARIYRDLRCVSSLVSACLTASPDRAQLACGDVPVGPPAPIVWRLDDAGRPAP